MIVNLKTILSMAESTDSAEDTLRVVQQRVSNYIK